MNPEENCRGCAVTHDCAFYKSKLSQYCPCINCLVKSMCLTQPCMERRTWGKEELERK